MPKLDQIYQMMEAQVTPYIRIWNLNKERLFTFENPTVAETRHQMEQLIPFISSYGKVIIEAADEKMKARSYQTSYKWTLEFDRPVQAAAVAGLPAPANPWGWNPPKEYMHQDVVAAKLKVLEAKMDHEKEMRLLTDKLKEKENQDPMKYIEKLGPPLMMMMGKPIEEIRQLASLYANPTQGGIAGPTNTLVFSDVQKMTSEEKTKRCQELADELAKYVSVEEMIILQSKLISKLKDNKDFMTNVFLYI